MGEIHIQVMSGPTVPETEVEIVERKGLGHPDTICDAVMEQVAVALARAYRDKFGAILHFNCDKGLLVAGRVKRRFGGGMVLEPMRLIIGDRASVALGRKRLDVAGVSIETAKAWFRKNLPRVNPKTHLRYQVELRPGSEELASLFSEKKKVRGANDTSAAVGYAPLTETERTVLEAERYLNTPGFKARFPETGQDVKVMGVRTGRRLSLTVAMPLIDQHVESEVGYFRRKQAVHEDLLGHLQKQTENLEEISLRLNSLDRRGKGMDGIYLSVIGTSAEDADSGEVGRGNQVNGLIALNRPRGSEAAAGKNPVSHVGKIYNVLAHVLAKRIYGQISGLRSVEVWLCSRIGEPVDRPQIVSVQIHVKPGVRGADLADPIRAMVEKELTRITDFCEELAEGRYPVC
ncbi:MAG TPA: methionine adenosyltransferase [Nitrospiria bacterium]|jgi:S-adenosylmethionine synthetase|nr:methionine adenosyltransferase [Nitrospiria bacterium]